MLPGGSVWNLVDFIPDELQAAASGRGGWTYAGSSLTSATKIEAMLYAPFTTGGKLIAIDQQPKLWDVLAASTLTATAPRIPVGPPVFHRQKVIIPSDSSANQPQSWDGTTLSTISGSPTGEFATVYKDHTVLAGSPARNGSQELGYRVWFSAAGDPTTWDLNFGWWDTSGTVTGVAGLTNCIVIHHADSTERLRGTTPPPGSDMVLEPLLPNVGCIDAFSIAYWQQNEIFASESGIYMTNGVSTVDLTAIAQMKTYWQSLMSGYSTTWRIAGGIYRDHYIVSINNGSTLIDSLCVNLTNRTMWRFTNLHGSSFVNVQVGQQEKCYMGQWNAGRVAELSSLWSPSGTVKQDADGTNPTPIIETGAYRGYDRLHRRWIQSMGLQKWRFAYLDYDLRDAASDNPTITLQYALTPGGSYTTLAGGSLPETTDYTRKRRSVGAVIGGAKRSSMVEFKVAVNGPYATANLYTLEGDFEPIDIGRLG